MKRFSSTFWILLVLLSMVAVVPQAQATSWDPAITSRPVNNQGQMGDALLGSFYRSTLSDINFLTYVSIENTTNRWVAAHVRLRSGRYSIEVIDFPILLSPYDVFWFQFDPDPDGNGVLDKVALWTSDAKTVQYSDLTNRSPGWTYVTKPFPRYEANLSGDLLKQFGKLNYDATDLYNEMSIGYVEVIGLFAANNVSGKSIGTFNSIMSTLYTKGMAGAALTFGQDGAYTAIDVTKELSGHVFNGDFTNGLYTAYTMEALKNFRTGGNGGHRDFNARAAIQAADTGGVIVYNIAGDAAYTDPDWATTFGPTWNDGDNVFSTLPAGIKAWQSWSIDEVDDALAKRLMTSPYFNKGFTGVTFTSAMVTYPTKYLHVNFTDWPVGMKAQAFTLRSTLDVAATVGSVFAEGNLWDLEEGTCNPGISPTTINPFKYEVNCMPIGGQSNLTSEIVQFCGGLIYDVYATPFAYMPGPSAVCQGPDFTAGQFLIQDFSLVAGSTLGDPRTDGADPAYQRTSAPLLNALYNTPSAFGNNLDSLIPAVVQVLDWDFTNNNPRSRAYYPAWDNPDFIIPQALND